MIITVASFFLLKNKNTYYSGQSSDITCYKDNRPDKKIPCSDDNDCSFEKMSSFCNPDTYGLLECPNARYSCGDDGYCKGYC